MAAGELFIFDDLLRQMSIKLVDLDTDTYKLGLVTTAVDPRQRDPLPVFGDYTEVSGTNYTAGGIDVSGTFAISIDGAVTSWTSGGASATWTQHTSGPADIRWGILYNDQGATKYAAAYINIGDGSDISLASSDIKFMFLANIARFTRA